MQYDVVNYKARTRNKCYLTEMKCVADTEEKKMKQ